MGQFLDSLQNMYIKASLPILLNSSKSIQAGKLL